MNTASLLAVAAVLTTIFGSGGVLLYRSMRSQMDANTAKIREERDGVAVVNADKLISLMDKQIQRFETEVTKMRTEADRYELISIRDSETIEKLERLLRDERAAHEAAMADERRRCDRAMEELHLRIDLLSKKVDVNSQGIDTLEHAVPLEGIPLGTPVVITPAAALEGEQP